MNNKSLNIWLINHYAGNIAYGMEYRHFFLARHLKKLGHNPRIISSSFHHLFTKFPDVKETCLFEDHDQIPFAFIKVPSYEGNGISRFWNTISFTRSLNKNLDSLVEEFGRPDVVLGSSPHPFVYYNLMKIKKKFGIPVIFEVRDLWPQMLIELGSISKNHPLSHYLYWLEKKTFENSDKVISLWHSADKYMYEKGLRKDKYIYLPNGIEMPEDDGEISKNFDHPLINQVRKRKEAGKFLVGYGGSHGYANPLHCIVDACLYLQNNSHDDCEFFMVGDGPLKKDIVEYAASKDVHNLHFYDYVDKEVIMAFYQEMDATYMGLRDLPLFKYGPTPNKLMDYLAIAKPIIYAINSSFNPVKEIGAGITIQPDQPEGLAKAILELKDTDAAELCRMGKAGHDYASKELNFSVLAGKLSDVFIKSVEENR